MAETQSDASKRARRRWAAIPTPEARRAEMAPLNEARRLYSIERKARELAAAANTLSAPNRQLAFAAITAAASEVQQ